jgi:hypothetical protein
MGSEASSRTISTASTSIARQSATNSSNVEASLAVLVLGDEALGLPEPPGDLSLSEPGRVPGTFEEGEEAFLGGGVDRFAHAPGLG